MQNLAIIQARMGSSRLPGKVLMDLSGKTVLERGIERVKKSKLVDEVIVATTMEKEDIPIVCFCSSIGIRVFCGSENDVLDRYYQAAKLIKPDNVIRITADCPLLDPGVLDLVIESHINGKFDYSSNTLNVTYPDGLDCEIMKYQILKDAWSNAALASEREHVTQYIIKHDYFRKCSVTNKYDFSSERWTLDTPDDYRFIKEVYSLLEGFKGGFTFQDIISLLNRNPELRSLNQNSERNEGLLKSLKNDHIVNLD